MKPGPIGIFDSGFGGLSVYKEIKSLLPQYSYIYLGDSARAPYGSLTFDKIYNHTLQAVEFLFDQGCHLVILACNTASAQALRTIQQNFLVENYPGRRVLGVIRPCTERALEWSCTNHIGLFGTNATVRSNSYGIEISKLAPEIKLVQQACPDWVGLVENGRISSEEAQWIVTQDLKKLLEKDPEIDTIILACTHFSHLEGIIRQFLGSCQITIINQGPIVAQALKHYLMTHYALEKKCLTAGIEKVYTTGRVDSFRSHGGQLMNFSCQVAKITLS